VRLISNKKGNVGSQGVADFLFAILRNTDGGISIRFNRLPAASTSAQLVSPLID
jgi:hypothetical protein